MLQKLSSTRPATAGRKENSMTRKEKRYRLRATLALVLVICLSMALYVPVQAKTRRVWRYTAEYGNTANGRHKYYYAYQKGSLIWLPDQDLEIEGELGPHGEILLGPETIPAVFNTQGDVSFFCYPAGSAGRSLPGRGAKDPFYSTIGNGRKVDFHGWVKGAKVIGWRNGLRSKFRIDYQGFPQQHIYLRKTHRKHNGRHIWRLYYK